MRSHVQPGERVEITDVHSLAALIARDPEFPERRRRLVRLVVITVSACALILVAAGMVRLLHPPPDPAAAAPITIASAPTPAAAPPAAAPVVDPAPAPPPVAPTTGTLRIQRPALPGHVWIDGTKVSTGTATVSCGKHKVKVGTWGHAHSIEVPCGGEIKISR